MNTSVCWLFFDVFASQKRMKIINALLKKPLSVSEICDKTGIEQSHVSHELKTMTRCKIVESKREGRNKIYKLPPGIKPILNAANKHMKKHCKKKCNDLKKKNQK